MASEKTTNVPAKRVSLAEVINAPTDAQYQYAPQFYSKQRLPFHLL